jgi:hypothetical protein
MKLRIILLLLFVFSISIVKSERPLQNFDKAAFYAILKSGKIDDINQELSLLGSSSVSEKDGYEGALLMRKGGLLKIPGEKLKSFKKGRILLETALANDNTNGEYHFLRLIIQEHAPKIVKYSADLETDKEHVKKSYKNLSPAVQQAIIDYSKSSQIIHPQDFQQ